MTDEAFEMLATKILAGEATPEERTQLDALLARAAARRNEFAELKAAWEAMRRFAPLTPALDAPPTPLPQYRLGELLSAARKHFSAKASEEPDSASLFKSVWLWLCARKAVALSVAAVVLIGGIVALQFRTGHRSETIAYLLTTRGEPVVTCAGKPVVSSAATTLRRGDEIELAPGVTVRVVTPEGALSLAGPQRWRAEKLGALVQSRGASARRGSAAVQTALFRPINQLLAANLLAVVRDGRGISLYCPRDATRRLTPPILWKNEPSKTYDVTITDEFDRAIPPRQLRGVVSPVDFAKAWAGRPLATNGLYRLVIRETANPVSAYEHTFRTLNDANGTPAGTPAEKIARAYELLAAESPCPGDALAELMTLPAEFDESELVLRLKVALFGQLGLREDYNTTAAKLTLLSQTQLR